MSAPNEPLALGLEEELTTRRPVTVEQHKLFIDSLLSEADLDEIDEECEIDPLLLDRPAQRRTNAQTSQLLDILDELDASGKGWEG